MYVILPVFLIVVVLVIVAQVCLECRRDRLDAIHDMNYPVSHVELRGPCAYDQDAEYAG